MRWHIGRFVGWRGRRTNLDGNPAGDGIDFDTTHGQTRRERGLGGFGQIGSLELAGPRMYRVCGFGLLDFRARMKYSLRLRGELSRFP